MQESGCKLDHPAAAKFQSHVMSGEWTEAEADLQDLKSLISSAQSLLDMRFLILEQKFLELLDDEQSKEGLLCLQTELTPLCHKTDRIHKLTMFVMAKNSEEFRRLANFDGKGAGSRRRLMERLQEYLPPEVMLPPRRLLALLNQAAELQKERCPFHNDLTGRALDGMSLLVDHACSRDEFPSEVQQILNSHYEEVVFCQFSNDGTKLATGSKDGSVIVWDIDPVSPYVSHASGLIRFLQETLDLKQKSIFDGHSFGVYFISWSPDDTYLLSCGPEDCPDVWVWNVQVCNPDQLQTIRCLLFQTGELRVKVNHGQDDSLTCCSWHKDGKKFVTGGTKGHFYSCVRRSRLLSPLV